MKKKVFLQGMLIISLIFGIFILTGCDSKNEEKENKAQVSEQTQEQAEQQAETQTSEQTGEQVSEQPEEQPMPTVDESLVTINGLEFHLNKETSFKDLKYTIVEDFKESNMDRYIQYNYYPENQSNLLFFRIFYYKGQKNDYAIKDLGLESNITLTDGKTDNIEYKFYESPRDDGGTMHFYFINKDGDTYALSFISKNDIKDFEEKVIKSVKF